MPFLCSRYEWGATGLPAKMAQGKGGESWTRSSRGALGLAGGGPAWTSPCSPMPAGWHVGQDLVHGMEPLWGPAPGRWGLDAGGPAMVSGGSGLEPLQVPCRVSMCKEASTTFSGRPAECHGAPWGAWHRPGACHLRCRLTWSARAPPL